LRGCYGNRGSYGDYSQTYSDEIAYHDALPPLF
jgi:hypothetical protein